MQREVEFTGGISGDSECFCFTVDKKTFVKVCGREPNCFDYMEIVLNEETGKYTPVGDVLKLYPNDIFEKEPLGNEDVDMEEVDIEEVVRRMTFTKPLKIRIQFEYDE